METQDIEQEIDQFWFHIAKEFIRCVLIARPLFPGLYA